MVRSDLKIFLSNIPQNVTLVAATKYADLIDLNELYSNGITNFGENRADSFLKKYEAFAEKEITWHFIGHLQSNKAKSVINKISYLHSLDSLSLAKEIQKYRVKPLKCFVEVSINLEENKNGVPFYEADNFIKALSQYNKIEIVGLMMMTVKASDENSQIEQFNKLIELRNKLETSLNIKLPYLSMGMSDDYLSALKCGATHIRLGRILFK